MTAYDSMRYDDLLQRSQVRGEKLTPEEQAKLARLDAQARKEWEAKPVPRWEGGHPDMF